MEIKIYGRDAAFLEKRAATYGIKFVPIPQRHIGSDILPSVVTSIKNFLESKGVIVKLNTEVTQIENNGTYSLTLSDGSEIESRFIIVATGRAGADWFKSEADRLGLKTRFAPIDIGVRVEVPSVVMENIIEFAWDPKFHINTKKYDEPFVRTFCTCPNGFVVMED